MSVIVDRENGIYTLTLNRPEAGNSVDRQTAAALEIALNKIETDTSAAALIISGTGDRFFCTGGDVKEYATLPTRRDVERIFRQMQHFCRRLAVLPIPVIAAADGMVVGGGAELMLACDLRIMREGATIQFPQVRLGLITGWGGHWRLVRVVGEARALDLLLTGRRIFADEAHNIGLIHRVAPSALTEARRMSDQLRRGAPLALRQMKQLVRAAHHQSYEKAVNEAGDVFFELWFSNDHREAEQAFMERREPRFTGT